MVRTALLIYLSALLATPAAALDDVGCDYKQCWDKNGDIAQWQEWRRRASPHRVECTEFQGTVYDCKEPSI